MPDPRAFTVAQELQFLNEIRQMEFRNAQFRKLMTPELAQNAGNLVLRAPYAPKEIVLPVARGITDRRLTQEQGENLVGSAQDKILKNPITYAFPDSKSAWDHIFGGIKSAVKWTTAGLSLPYDIVTRAGGGLVSAGIEAANIPGQITTNVARTGSVVPQLQPNLTGQIIAGQQMAPIAGTIGAPDIQPIESIRGLPFTPPEGQSLGTLWRSTQLGALTSGLDSGSGWFVGERAAQSMNEAALKVSGGIGGLPLSPGGGLALTVSQPGTKPFAIISGLTDMAIGFAVPAPIPSKLFGRAAAGLADINIGAITEDTRPLLRSFAGLTNFESPYVATNKVINFLDSTVGQWLINKLAAEKNYSKIAKWFPNTDINFRLAIAEAGDAATVRTVLEDSIGLSKGLTNVEDFNFSRWSDVKRGLLGNGAARWTGVERLAAKRPGWELALITDDVNQQTRSVENLSNYLTMLKVDPEIANPLINEFARTLIKDPGNLKNVTDRIVDTIAEGIAARRPDMTPDRIKKLIGAFAEIRDQYKFYGLVNPKFEPEMFGLSDVPFEGITTATGQRGLFTIPDGTAMTAGEMRRAGLVLPDPDRVYRATSDFRWLFEKGSILNRDPLNFGKARSAIVLMDWLTNRAFKTLVTMTGGFITRALSESLMREALAPGLRLGVFHPLEHIRTSAMTSGFGKYIGDIEGLPFAEYAEGIIRREMNNSSDLVSAVSRGRYDPRVLELKAAQTKTWQFVDNTMDQYPQMLMDNIQLISSDEIYRLVAKNFTNEQIIYEMGLRGSDAEKALNMMQKRYSNLTSFNTQTGVYEKATLNFVDEAGNINEKAVSDFIDNYVRPRVHYVTGGEVRADGTIINNGHPALLEIIANGDRLGEFTMNNKTVRAFKTAQEDAAGQLIAIDYSDEFREQVRNLIDDPDWGPRLPQAGKARNNAPVTGVFAESRQAAAQIADRVTTRFFSVLFDKPDVYLNRSPVWRQFYYLKVNDLLDHLAPGEARFIRDAVLDARGYQAKELLGKLERLVPDPVTGEYDLGWRKASASQFDALVENTKNEIAKAAAKSDEGWGARYVGSKETWKKINDLADGKLPSKGDLTAKEVSDASRSFAADETMSTLYNASRDNNFAQVMRIVAPFGPAWAEFWSNLSRTVMRAPQNIQKTKNAAVLVDGMRGFFGIDPVTGEPIFNYLPTDAALPILGAVAGLGIGAVTGGLPGAVVASYLGARGGQMAAEKVAPVAPELVSPAKALNVGFNVLPGLSPVVQIAANLIVPDKPSTDFIRNFVSPYGPPAALAGVMPSWLNKLSEAITADPETDRIYAAMRMDAFVALMASGKYNRMDNNEISKAWDKAGEVGRYLTVARAIGQFVGPGRPGVQMMVPTKYEGQITIEDVQYLVKDGNIPNVVAAKLFRQLQSEDITTAVTRYLDILGEDFMYYTAGRTKTTVGGLDASKEFNNWERNNQSFADSHKNVYGWFGPVGSDLSKQAYIRQITTGRRETRKDPVVLVRDTEYIVASALYRNYVANNQPNINPDGTIYREEKNRITELYEDYRATLKQVFPGYDYKSIDSKATATRIKEVIAAANDPRIQDNVVAQVVQTYNDFREQAIGIANSPARRPDGPVTDNILTGNKNADLRAALRDFGDRLAIANPEFQRIWEDVFYYEVDEVGT